MDIQLQITPNTAPLIKNALSERLDKVTNELGAKKIELKRLETEKQELEKQIQEIENALAGITISSNGYENNKTVVDKIKYVLKHTKQPLTSREIADRLMILEPALGGENKANTIKNVSTLLSINKGEGKAFKRIEKEGEDNRFTLN
jgi:septal ring factor EnvC (AmiA/AmiB activator)